MKKQIVLTLEEWDAINRKESNFLDTIEILRSFLDKKIKEHDVVLIHVPQKLDGCDMHEVAMRVGFGIDSSKGTKEKYHKIIQDLSEVKVEFLNKQGAIHEVEEALKKDKS